MTVISFPEPAPMAKSAIDSKRAHDQRNLRDDEIPEALDHIWEALGGKPMPEPPFQDDV